MEQQCTWYNYSFSKALLSFLCWLTVDYLLVSANTLDLLYKLWHEHNKVDFEWTALLCLCHSRSTDLVLHSAQQWSLTSFWYPTLSNTLQHKQQVHIWYHSKLTFVIRPKFMVNGRFKQFSLCQFILWKIISLYIIHGSLSSWDCYEECEWNTPYTWDVWTKQFLAKNIWQRHLPHGRAITQRTRRLVNVINYWIICALSLRSILFVPYSNLLSKKSIYLPVPKHVGLFAKFVFG